MQQNASQAHIRLQHWLVVVGVQEAPGRWRPRRTALVGKPPTLQTLVPEAVVGLVGACMVGSGGKEERGGVSSLKMVEMVYADGATV